MPAAARCSTVKPPPHHAPSLPYELRDLREPPICTLVVIGGQTGEGVPKDLYGEGCRGWVAGVSSRYCPASWMAVAPSPTAEATIARRRGGARGKPLIRI
jgi:hypothetical protein